MLIQKVTKLLRVHLQLYECLRALLIQKVTKQLSWLNLCQPRLRALLIQKVTKPVFVKGVFGVVCFSSIF